MAEFFSSDQLMTIMTPDGLAHTRAASAAALQRPRAAVPAGDRVVAGIVRTARPRQWLKNTLVLAAPAAAGAFGDLDVLAKVLLAFVVFSLAASGTYFVNDAQDAAADARHPVKRHRPVAAGIVPVALARRIGVALMTLALALGLAAGGPALALVALTYLALTLAYTFRLKQEPVLDIATIAVGFVLRAVAGGIATGIPLTEWFLIVVSFGALFLATGKRLAEASSLGTETDTRASLAAYSVPYLRHVAFASATMMILAYCAWVIRQIMPSVALTVSILPLVLAVLRYALLLEHGEGEAAEEVALTDRPLQVLGLAWACLFTLGVYLT